MFSKAGAGQAEDSWVNGEPGQVPLGRHQNGDLGTLGTMSVP